MFCAFLFTLVVLILDVFATAPPTLIILSFENFHPENTEAQYITYFESFRSKASGPSTISPIFPITTFSNLFTMATGVQADVHGIYNDLLFDGEDVIKPSKEHFQTNKELVPLWTENEKAGNERISGVMMWPGSEYEYHGVTPTYVQAYDSNIPWETRAETILDWMTRSEKRANLVMAHFEKQTECFNAENALADMNNYSSMIDNTIKQIHTTLLDKLGEDGFHLIITADHGTEDVNIDHVLIVENYVPKEYYSSIIVSGSLVFINAKKDSYDALLNGIKKDSEKFSILKKSDILNTYKLDIPALENVIILLAHDLYGFFLQDEKNRMVKELGGIEDLFYAPVYGYDITNLEMHGYIVCIGPKYRSPFHTYEIFSVADVYPMFKFLLDLPEPASNVQNKIELHKNVKNLFTSDIFPNDETTQNEANKSKNVDDGDTEKSEKNEDNNTEKSESDGNNNTEN